MTASLAASSRSVVLTIDDGYHSTYTNIFPLLAKKGMTATLALTVNYIREGPPRRAPSPGFLSTSEVREMTEACGVEIASHSLSHPFLTKLSPAQALREISTSRAALEDRFGAPVRTFVYPYGDVNAAIREMAKDAGYELGRSVREGEPDFIHDPFRLPALELRRSSLLADVKRAISSRRTTILLLHQAVASPRAYTQWSLLAFTQLLDWLKEEGINTLTLAGCLQNARDHQLRPSP